MKRAGTEGGGGVPKEGAGMVHQRHAYVQGAVLSPLSGTGGYGLAVGGACESVSGGGAV